MILGHMSNLVKDSRTLPDVIYTTLDMLNTYDPKQLTPGRYDLDGDKVFALVQRYKTRELKDCRAETHAKYIDIQYVADGAEYIGHTPYSPLLEIEEDCLEARDALFYKVNSAENRLHISAGTYAVFYPTDVHRPCVMINTPDDVVKVVFKIHVDAV